MMAKLDEIEKVCSTGFPIENHHSEDECGPPDARPVLPSQTSYRGPYSRDAHGYAFHRHPHPFPEVAGNTQWYTRTIALPATWVSVAQLF